MPDIQEHRQALKQNFIFSGRDRRVPTEEQIRFKLIAAEPSGTTTTAISRGLQKPFGEVWTVIRVLEMHGQIRIKKGKLFWVGRDRRREECTQQEPE